MIFAGAIGGDGLLFVDNSHVSLDFAHSCTLALMAPLAGSAEAGVGDSSGSALSSFGRLSPVQTVQYGGDCWYDNGSNGPGYYPCGDEWNSGLGGAGSVGPIIAPAIRRHHRHGVFVAHPKVLNPVYPGAPSRRLGAGVPAPDLRGGVVAPALAVVHGFVNLAQPAFIRRPVSTPALRRSPAGLPAADSMAALAAAILHQFHGSGVPHIGAPVSPGFAGGGGLHGLGGATASPHRRACLSKFCGRRDLSCRRRDGSPTHRRASLARFCGWRVSWRWRGRSFPGGGAALGLGGIGHR